MRTGRASALTDTGRRRPQNEDTFVCEPPLFAVADGVGGAQAGEIASRLAADALEERTTDAFGEQTLVALIRTANDRIYRHSLEDPSAAGMGTVMTALLADEGTGDIAIGHVGDSRAYRLRDGVFEQLTPDHSLVGDLVRSGQLTPEEAENHPHRSVITRAVGTEPTVDVETLTVAAEPGDLYLICSDGLTDIVRDEQIADLIRKADHDPDAAAEALVAAANRAGGIDNITVVLFEIVEGDPVPSAGRPSRSRSSRDEDTAEQATAPSTAAAAAEPEAVPVRRHGAGAGGRWLALLAIILALAVAAMVVWWSLGAVSARNKELLNLGFAALVASAAFASVSIVGTGLVSARWLGYVGVIFGLYVVAHVVARFTVPYADPTLLPLVGLLTALGLTVIYRLGPDDARRQAVWVAVGIGVLAATLIWLRFDYRVLERYKYLFGISAVVLLLLPSVPGLGHRVNGVKIWVKVGPMQFQPGELAKIFMIIFLAGYLRDKREALARGRLKDLGPLLVIWGASMLVLVQTSDLGSALLNFGIFLAMVYVTTGRAIYVRVGLALFVGGVCRALQRARPRPAARHRLAAPLDRRPGLLHDQRQARLPPELRLVPARQEPLLDRERRLRRYRARQGHVQTVDGTQLIPYLNTDFIYSAIAQELGLIGAAGDAADRSWCSWPGGCGSR